MKILMVCHANICRSPMAEFILRDMLERAGLADEIIVESAAVRRETYSLQLTTCISIGAERLPVRYSEST